MIARWISSRAIRAFAGMTMLVFAAGHVSAQELEQTELSLHYQNNNVFVPLSVALEKGWFEEAGFSKVDTKSFTAGALAGEALLAGEISAWMPGNVPVISMRHNALPVVVVGNIVSVYEKMVVRPDANVTKPEDLYNIRIGLLEGSTASAVLSNLADHYGLDASRLTTVNLPPPEQVTSLVANEVQAIIVWEPFATQARKEVDGSFLVADNVSQFEQDKGQPLVVSHTLVPIVFSEDFVKANPNTARTVVEVINRATEWVLDPANKEEAIKLHAKVSERSEESVAGDWDGFFFNPALDDKYVEDMRNYTRFMEKAGRISDAIDPLKYTYTGILEEIDPTYAKIKGEWQP